MKRNEHLMPLTHDHHHALVQARRLKLAAGEAPEQRLEAGRGFLDFYERDTLLHFREEEEVVFPLVVGHEEAEAPLTRLLLEHLRIHALVGRLRTETDAGEPSTVTLSELSTTLEQHVRFEEKTMFPLIERLVAPALDGVELAERDRSPSDDPSMSVEPS